MKKILTIITIITAAALSSYAQPRAMGVRFGTTGLEADYQHDMKKNQFVEGNLGLDFGTLSDGTPGLKATAIYNFIWAHPAWTDRGTWALYAGLREQLALNNVPKAFRGIPIALITASLLAMAFMGFSGLV